MPRLHPLTERLPMVHGTHPDQMEVAGPDTIPRNATNQEVINPTMVDLTVLDSASEVDDHVVPRRVKRLRIMGTQPTTEDPRSSNRFSALDRDSDTDTIDNSWEGTSPESGTESLPDPEFRV